ncbi:MAG TPA: tetratricopeptide repeat protein [Verrucomicrobiae bacterium]
MSVQNQKKLLLIGWEAADWSLINPLMDAGQMPALNRIVEEGVSGRLLCADPPIGAAQWTSIATGKRPWQHGICHSLQPTPDGQKLGIVSSLAQRSKAIWEIFAERGMRGIIAGWPATHGAAGKLISNVSDRYHEPTSGPGIKPWPPTAEGTYHPADLGSKLDQLRVSPEDIQADLMAQYIPQWQKIDQKRDRRLGILRVLIAADLSYHAAVSELVRSEPWDFAAVRFPAFGQIARIFLPYAAPRRKSVPEEDFILYEGVVRSAARVFDLMLARLLATMDPNTAVVVVSAHGSRGYEISSRGVPHDNDEQWKTPYGIFAARGEGFARDALLHGATVMDVAPTLLDWFGLPIGDDMEGRVLLEGFTFQSDVQRIASWETAGDPPKSTREFAANNQVHAWQQERDWHYVRSCLDAAQYHRAMPVLETLFRKFPERPELGQTLFRCQLELKRVPEARETLEVVLETIPPGALSALLRAELAWAERNISLAHSLLGEALALKPTNPGVMSRIGILLLRLRQWDSLEKLARGALSMDDQNPIAWLGLAEALLRKRQGQAAAEAAVRAIGLKYFLPDAHFILVRALLAEGKWAQARDAMEALQKIQPDNRAAAMYSKRMPQNESPPKS